MGRIYTVVFNGDVSTLTLTTSNIFFYDWGQLPEGEYKVSFSFISGIATLINTNCANVHIDLGQNANMSTSNGQGIKSGYLGFLRFSGTGASNYLFASTVDNPPVYLMNRPANNRVMVEIKTSTNSIETNYSPVPVAYTLCLSFELQE